MTGHDFDDIARLWQEPEGGEQEMVEAMARKVRRRARLLGLVDIAFGILIGAATLIGIFSKPGPVTAAIGALVIAAILGVNWKRRELRQMALTIDATDRQHFIESATGIALGNLRRVSLSLLLVPPLILLAVLFKLSYRDQGLLEHPLQTIIEWALSPRGLANLGVVVILVVYLVQARRRIKAELRRLEELRKSYREEAILDDAD